MSALAPYLMIASAAVVFALGTVHLLFTFRGRQLQPRDAELTARLQRSTLGITRQTTVWKAWIGFNASHSLGAMLFAASYGYLALQHGPLLFSSEYLLALGLVVLCAYLWLAWRYWFSSPFYGIALALVLYLLAWILRWT
ncbi:MAG: hypothetical protein AAF481_00310 [Acidobacteriota bacterium]